MLNQSDLNAVPTRTEDLGGNYYSYSQYVTGDQLANNGALRVNDYLQVVGYDNIYAIGDCSDVKEPKTMYHAQLHANIVVTNIVNSLNQKPLKSYKPGSLTFLISLGCNDEVGQISEYYVGRLLVAVLKSKEIFLSKSWKKMQQHMPS